MKPYSVGLSMLCMGLSACAPHAPSSSGANAGGPPPHGRTMGFVLSNYEMFYHSKDDKADCPAGFRYTSRDNWEAQFPTQALRAKHLSRCGEMQNRGPNCENVWFTPEVVRDPLPFRELKGETAVGADLDGVGSGVATDQVCPHENFIDPDGKPGIDNQYYRFFGCVKALRDVPQERTKKLLAKTPLLRLLLEINGVDDERDDPAVEVTMYRGRDPLLLDAAGNAVPWQSQRIDEAPESMVFRVRGRIVAGELLTEPTDVMWDSVAYERRLLIRGMSLRLKLHPTGAEGLRVGYIDIDQFWQSYSRNMAGWGTLVAASGPSDYAALHRMADGYKDPRTGACTALSSGRKYEFVRANIIHPARG